MKSIKKIFSTENLFFTCIVAIFMFSYYYYEWQRNRIINANSANAAFIIMIIVISFWLPIRFPFFVKKRTKIIDESDYKNIYTKEIDFWSHLFIGIFHWTKPNEMISLFSNNILKIGINGKDCEFSYSESETTKLNRICDILLTLIFGSLIFFFAQEFSKVGIVFGMASAVIWLLFRFKKIILNRIFSVIVGKDEDYRIGVMYSYSAFDGFIFRDYGFAYYFSNIILLHKEIFSGGDILKEYIFAHEKGHLKTVNRIKNFWTFFIFIFASFLFFTSMGFLIQIGVKSIPIMFIPLVFYGLFFCVYIPIMRTKNEKDEFLADIYAIKTIGKGSVLKGLKIIRDDESYKNIKIKFSGTSIDRRIKFVREYTE